MNMSKLQAVLIVGFLVGIISNVDDIVVKYRAYQTATVPAQGNTPMGYASQIPLPNAPFEDHIAYLKTSYQDCALGQNYLNTISAQHKVMPYSNAMEISIMVEQMCSDDSSD